LLSRRQTRQASRQVHRLFAFKTIDFCFLGVRRARTSQQSNSRSTATRLTIRGGPEQYRFWTEAGPKIETFYLRHKVILPASIELRLPFAYVGALPLGGAGATSCAA
jgi:hypothetical protein